MSSRRPSSRLLRLRMPVHVSQIVLIAFTATFLLNCIHFSSTLSTPDNQESHIKLNKELVDSNADSFTVNEKRREYNFGIGKRDSEQNDQEGLMAPNAYFNEENVYDEYGNIEEKRSNMPQRFSFGLGKRAPQRNVRYQFGIGKRAPVQRYQFGIGKRTPQLDQLGMAEQYKARVSKRTPQTQHKAKATPNNMHLQEDEKPSSSMKKRSIWPWASMAGNKKISNFDEFMKRRYSFGLGK